MAPTPTAKPTTFKEETASSEPARSNEDRLAALEEALGHLSDDVWGKDVRPHRSPPEVKEETQ